MDYIEELFVKGTDRRSNKSSEMPFGQSSLKWLTGNSSTGNLIGTWQII